ncbi:MAG: agmatinase [Candidatus Margulisbacteria bacterium]|nr:agmatinase [Candidatus Margulisiibacteriota bacterium]
MSKLKPNRVQFLEYKPAEVDYAAAKFVVLPVPYEATTTYGKGTKNGPAAILSASQYVENFDEELWHEPCEEAGIFTGRPVSVGELSGKRVAGVLADNKVPVILGGEHSITPLVVRACAEKYKDLSVLQFDAHADLRDTYHGAKDSHACVMRRVLEICPAVQVGIRSISEEGYEFAKKTGQLSKIHWAEHLEIADKITTQLSNNVYITFDVDAFDPAIMPSTGTPEPGGLLWYEALDILKAVCRQKNVVGFDVTEFSPQKGNRAPDFMIARLIYKIMGFIGAKNQ